MAKKMLIDATHAEETRVVVADGQTVEEFDFESLNKRQLAGNIYLAKVTRVEPSLQAAFVDYGGNRHGFLAFSEIHPDYFQIPVADREALLAQEQEEVRAEAEEEAKPTPKRARARRKKSDAPAAERAGSGDAVARSAAEIGGMDVIDMTEGAEGPVADFDAAAADPGAADAPEVQTTATDDATAAERPDAAVASATGAESRSGEQGAAAGAEGPETAGHAARRDDPDIDTVADDDVEEDIRPARKPRARKYKIQEVIKVRQILLVQVVKEERGNKGAALTTYLSLAGRYCVLMPNTARGGGISRKITVAADRKKLKEIATSLDVPQGAGLIVRTAGAKRTKIEIKRDYEYLQRQWEQVRELTLKSIAPAPIYEEGNLIHRSIRDLYTREIDEVLVEGEAGYRQAKDFMKMIMPSHAKNVKHYHDPMPLFARHKVEGYLADMFNPAVQLKSGGYIVIGITEALVAIDVNSGRATKEGSIEETALKTNLEAAEEVARQVRLRDLAGLIVIDFIDMDERRNNNAVEKRLKERLKTDRARIQVGRISAFGLLEMSRQRLRPGMLEASTQPCPACHGTGLLRSNDSVALTILRQLEEEGTRGRSREVLVRAPVAIINFLVNVKRDYLAAIEVRYGLSVRLEADAQMIAPDYKIEKFKTATRKVAASPVITMNADLMDAIEEDASTEAEADAPQPEANAGPAAADPAPEGAATRHAGEAGEDGGSASGAGRKRRRRRGGRGRGKKGEGSQSQAGDTGSETNGDGDGDGPEASPATETPAEPVGEPEAAQVAEAEAAPVAEAHGAQAGDVPADDAGAADTPTQAAPKRRRRARAKAKSKPAEAETATAQQAGEASAEAVVHDRGDSAAAQGTATATAADVEPSAAADSAAAAPTQPEPERGVAETTVDSQEATGPAPGAHAGAPGDGPDPRPGRSEADDQTRVPAEAAAGGNGAAKTETAANADADAPAGEAAPTAERAPRRKRRGWWTLDS